MPSHTAKVVARIGKVFGMRVIVYRRSAAVSASDVDTMLSADNGDTLAQLLDEADVIMLAAQLTDATYLLFSANEFARIVRSARSTSSSRTSGVTATPATCPAAI